MNSPSPSPSSARDKKLLAKVAELQGKKQLPEQIVALAAEVTGLQNDYLPRVAFTGGRESLDKALMRTVSSREQRYAGAPILPGRDFPLDVPLITELVHVLLSSLPQKVSMLAAYAPELAAKLDAPGILEDACREILDPSLAGAALPLLGAWAEEHPQAPHFFRFIVTSAMMPSVAAVGRILGEEHDAEKVWEHGHCPVCGNQPLIGRLVDKEGRRMHDCSFCGFEWRAPRMGCPFCLAPETEGSEYYVSDDEPGYLLSVCKPCGCYFKLGDFRECDRPWFPLLDDLSSLTLDLYAAQLGYKRPTLSGWGF